MTPDPEKRRLPLQFGIRTLLVATVALAVLLSALRWMGAAPGVVAGALGVLAVAVVAAVLFVAALDRALDTDHNDSGPNE